MLLVESKRWTMAIVNGRQGLDNLAVKRDERSIS